jgi:P2-related tail formation protein
VSSALECCPWWQLLLLSWCCELQVLAAWAMHARPVAGAVSYRCCSMSLWAVPRRVPQLLACSSGTDAAQHSPATATAAARHSIALHNDSPGATEQLLATLSDAVAAQHSTARHRTEQTGLWAELQLQLLACLAGTAAAQHRASLAGNKCGSGNEELV